MEEITGFCFSFQQQCVVKGCQEINFGRVKTIDERKLVNSILWRCKKHDITKELVKFFDVDIPVVPPLTDEEKERRKNPDFNPTVARCGECGMEWKRVMMYSCPHPFCPMYKMKGLDKNGGK